MKCFLLLALLCAAAAAVPAFESPNEVDDAAIVEGSKAFSLLLPAVALPYTVALIAVLVPLAKAFVLAAMNVFNLPFEVLVALYLLLHVAMFTFPQLASLLKLTTVFTARSESARTPRAAGEPHLHAVEAVMDWARDYVPQRWLAAIMTTEAPVVTTTSESTTTEGSSATAKPTASTAKTSKTGEPEVSKPTSKASAAVMSAKRPGSPKAPSTSSKCASFRVCESTSRLVKDYPLSTMVFGYLSHFLEGLTFERAVPRRDDRPGLRFNLPLL
ncbi:hypothetical protein MTO96_041224 [Rhipicephalus appendiculatus]